jgi:hypothetical protein
LATVDWATGEVRRTGPFKPPQQLTRVVIQKDRVLAFAGAFGMVGLFTFPELKSVERHHGGHVTCVADDVQYYANGPRVFAHDLKTGQPMWQTTNLGGGTTFLAVTGKHLLAIQDLPVPGDKDHRWFQVAAILRATGEVVSLVPGLARDRSKTEMFGGALFVGDAGYCYQFGEPGEPAGPRPGETKRVRIEQAQGDPDAIAAVKLARDHAGIPNVPPAGKRTPVIDGSLSDWQDAAWERLEWPDHWLSDTARLSAEHPRRPAGDFAAEFALAQDARRVYIGVRVHDAVHDARSSRPLWCGDSVGLLWRSLDNRGAVSFALTGALVDQVPCVEQGTSEAPARAMPDTSIWPEGLRLTLLEKDVPWLRRWESRALKLSNVQFAARRDDAAGETTYEWSILADLLPGPRDAKSELLWDLRVNDADGHGRLGEVALGSSSMQMRMSAGLARWPVFEETTATGPAAAMR